MASIKKFGLKAISAFLAIVLLLLSLPLTALAQTSTYETSGDIQGDRISEMSVVIRQAETSSVISSVTYRYEYDANGNIEKVYSGDVLVYRYAYDDLGQLIREDNYYLNKSYVYTYDTAGNITLKEEYAFTTGELGARQNYYLYRHNNSDWGDQLTASYNLFEGTQTIVYDAVGNPIIVGDYNGAEAYYASGYELSWDGRALTQYRAFTNDGEGTVSYGTTISYTYNADGIRTSKTVNGVEHQYYLSGSQIMAEAWIENGVEHTLIYIYDESGSPIGLKYRTDGDDYNEFQCFFFEKNLQGDIIAVYNEFGEKIGTYFYDAWGKQTATAISTDALEAAVVTTYNPFRYRGYYYDVETGWYYLQSRYYNSTWGRFLNADDAALLGANGDLQAFNLYAYCSNNPILLVDPDGEFALLAVAVGAVVGAVVNTVSRAASNIATGKKWSDGLWSAAITGALSGGLAATGWGPAAQIIGNALISGGENIIEQGEEKGYDNIDFGEVLFTATVDGLMSADAGISKGVSKHFTTMEQRSFKAIGNAFSKQGFVSGTCQIGKSAKYYFSQTGRQYFKTFVVPLRTDLPVAFASDILLP